MIESRICQTVAEKFSLHFLCLCNDRFTRFDIDLSKSRARCIYLSINSDWKIRSSECLLLPRIRLQNASIVTSQHCNNARRCYLGFSVYLDSSQSFRDNVTAISGITKFNIILNFQFNFNIKFNINPLNIRTIDYRFL